MKILLIIALAGIRFISHSQDIHFSQFYASPLTLNPANTGKFDGDWRVTDIYRRQWFAMEFPFVTNSVGIDFHFYIKEQVFSLGVNASNDHAGDINLSMNKLYLSGAYKIKVNKSNFHLGVQVGWVMKNFSYRNITFPDQYDDDAGIYSSQIQTLEPGLGDNMGYFDLNAGIIWTRKFEKFEPEIGYAMFHINQPNESYFDWDNKLTSRQVFHMGIKWDLNDNFFIHPNLLFMTHSQANDLVAGSNFGLKIRKNKKKGGEIYIGGFMRSGINRNVDAAIITAGFNLKKLDFGIAYDVNVSSLNSISNFHGAFEISVIYRHSFFKYEKLAIPCDRY